MSTDAVIVLFVVAMFVFFAGVLAYGAAKG